jgi:hypothetical protein
MSVRTEDVDFIEAFIISHMVVKQCGIIDWVDDRSRMLISARER